MRGQWGKAVNTKYTLEHSGEVTQVLVSLSLLANSSVTWGKALPRISKVNPLMEERKVTGSPVTQILIGP